MNRRPLILALTALVVAGVVGWLVLTLRFPPVEGGLGQRPVDPAFAELDPWVQAALLDEHRPVVERYEDLFRYLVAGFVAYRLPGGAAADYPGMASLHGRRADTMEGFSRIAPLMAAWLHSGRPTRVRLPRLGEVDLVAMLVEGIRNGTDPDAPAYWGPIGQAGDNLIEAADIALALWLARDQVWPTLDTETQRRVLRWLQAGADQTEVGKNRNWHLFPMLISRVLVALGGRASDEAYAANWRAVRDGHVGDGWFRDNPGHGIDYYNAWGFHYAMFWLTQIDTRSEAGTAPGTDTAFVDATRRAFVRSYRHLFSERGLPIFGRSICYRTAASAPLLISARQGDGVITPGEARRAFDRSWRYFVNRGALAGGTLTQGYCAADARILDRYSGPASCLWGTRSLVIALLDRAGAPFWSDPERPLAVELGDFDLSVRAAGLRITGDRARGAVEVEPLAATSGAVPLQPYTWRHRLAEAVLRRPFRPENEAAKYQGAVYASAEPFCGCPTPGLE